MSIIQSISDHRAAVVALPAASLYNALTVNSVYKLYKTVSAGVIECYIKITSKTPITLPGEQTPYDCSITGPAVYIEKNSSNVITGAEIGIRSISNLISNKTHLASDNWLIYTSSISEYNSMVDLVIDNMSSGTIAGPSGEIESISDHRTAVENLPAPALYNALTVNSIYMLQKQSSNKTIKCYIKIASKTAITYPNTSDIYDCTITGPTVYIETDSSGNITLGEIGKREITNLISSKTHLASDNWTIYASNKSEYNAMVDEVISYIIYTTPDPNHLSFTSKQNGSTVGIISRTSTDTPPDFEYSYDTVTWTPWPYTTSGPDSDIYLHTFSSITLNYNERIYVRSHATTLNIGASSLNYSRFLITGKIAAAGNIQSLINYSDTVPNYCYYNLFSGCAGLTTAPMLPATTLAASCYANMFYNCTSLTTAPELPATTLTDNCYNSMFRGCTSLTTAPALPATKLAYYCYRHMFRECTSLIEAPELPATTLFNYCYQYMFCECTSLTTVPRLPATVLANHCYQYMFFGCSHITEGADLQHVTSTTTECCNYMYHNCSQLSSAVTPRISSWNAQQFASWLGEVAPTGIVYKPNDLTIPTNNASGIPTGWTSAEHHAQVCLSAKGTNNVGFSYTLNGSTYNVSQGTEILLDIKGSDIISINTDISNVIKVDGEIIFLGSNVLDYSSIMNKTITCSSVAYENPLCFTANDSTCLIGMTHYGTNQTTTKPVMYISINGGTFSSWDFSSVSLSAGDKVYIIGPNTKIGSSTTNYSTFNISGHVSASGNIQSLISFSNTISANYCFCSLFYNCGNLIEAPELPATSLSNYCYYYMFYGCTGLVEAPELPATTLTIYCYYWMFYGCTGLVEAPELPATTLQSNCYNGMFRGCTSLTIAPELPATTLKASCYSSMFRDCTGLTTPPELPATTMINSCYRYMFQNCTNLIAAPILPATTIANYCYNSMFMGCTSLDVAPDLPATTMIGGCYQYMFRGCTSLIEAPELPATTLASSCYSYMFYGCTNLTMAPELPATTLQSNCYEYMFYNCEKLAEAPELPAATLVTNCYSRMFYGCELIDYIKVSAESWDTAYTTDWLYGVAASGTVYKHYIVTIPTNSTSGIPNGWNAIDYNGPLTFTATNSSTQISMEHYGTNRSSTTPIIYISTDGGLNWSLWNFNTITLSNIGDKVMMYGNNPYGISSSDSDYSTFTIISGVAAVGGDCTTLIRENGSLSVPPYCFYALFKDCWGITSAPVLPATTLSTYCYADMFYGCNNLEIVPKFQLPATALAEYCYYEMYSNSTVNELPDLPAILLAEGCYSRMFES